MARKGFWAGAAVLIGGAVLVGVTVGTGILRGSPGAPIDEPRIAELLADHARPWWQGHKLPMPREVRLSYGAPDKMGAFPEPPVACPVMPVELARGLVSGRARIPEGHPFQGRPVRLVDMRLTSRHLVEHIPDSVNAPWSVMAESLKSGVLRGTDSRTVVILYGEVYPHYDATAPFRVAGFDAYYCLEGGMDAWKAKGYPVTSSAPVAEYLKALEDEKVVVTGPDPLDPANIGPAALKALIEQGLDLMIIFVGDENTYKAGHIRGAIRVPADQVEARLEKEPRDRLIAVYCGCCTGSAQGLSGIAVQQLRKMKFTRLLHLDGHLKAWRDQGFALDLN